MSTFDPTKPVQTRDGRKARIICTDANSKQNFPIIALVDDGGIEIVQKYRSTGHWMAEREPNNPWDLVNVREKKKIWIYKHPGGGMWGCDSRYDCPTAINLWAIVEVEEGQGL